MKKKVYWVLAFSILLFFGCEKQEVKLSMDARLSGQWEYIKAMGGFTANQLILPPAGTKITLIFSSDHKYKRNTNGQTVEQGVYDIIKVRSIFTGTEENAIRFNNFLTQAGQIIALKNDSLWITDNHVEPFRYLYIKMK